MHFASGFTPARPQCLALGYCSSYYVCKVYDLFTTVNVYTTSVAGVCYVYLLPVVYYHKKIYLTSVYTCVSCVNCTPVFDCLCVCVCVFPSSGSQSEILPGMEHS